MNQGYSRYTFKPHPPDFNEGRRIQFSDFKILVEDSGIFVIFTEIKERKLIQTKVNSDAILWK
jgi:Zn/Cd-binding protein ZinT